MINILNINKMKNLIYNTMKKVLVVLFVALTMIGCKEDNTIEGRVSRAMKEYAEKNFDDPKTLIEITEVEKTDVINVREDIEDALENCVLNDSLYNSTIDDLINKMTSVMDNLEPKRIKSEIKREQLATLCLDWAEWLGEKKAMDLMLQGRNIYFNDIKSLIMNDTLYPISLYDIKVRVKDKGELKLKTYYTWTCDTTQVIKISSEPITTDSFEKEMGMMEKCKTTLKYDLELNEYLSRGKDTYNTFKTLLD